MQIHQRTHLLFGNLGRPRCIGGVGNDLGQATWAGGFGSRAQFTSFG